MKNFFAVGIHSNGDISTLRTEPDGGAIRFDYAKGDMNKPIALKSFEDANQAHLEFTKNQGLKVVPEALIRSVIGDKLALFYEAHVHQGYATEQIESGKFENGKQAAQAYAMSFVKRLPRLLKALPRIRDEYLLLQDQNRVPEDAPDNFLNFCQDVYFYSPESENKSELKAESPKNRQAIAPAVPPASTPKPNLFRWPDLKSVGGYLFDTKEDGGERSQFILLDRQSKADIEALKKIGFVPPPWSPITDQGIYVLDAQKQVLKPSMLAQAFGLEKCPMVEVDRPTMHANFAAEINQQHAANIKKTYSRALHIGKNHDDCEVYETNGIRFFQLPDSRFVSESNINEIGINIKSTHFFRASTDAELRECCQSLVDRIQNGQKVTGQDFKTFAEYVFNTKSVESSQLHRLQEALEAAATAYALESFGDLNEELFKTAQDIYYGLPQAQFRSATTIALQQYSTPLPLSVIAQKLLIGHDDVSNKTVLEPSIGHGSLVSALPETIERYGVELDRNRLNALNNSNIQVIQGDATKINFKQEFDVDGFDYVITNPPFGQMPQSQSFDKLPTVRKFDQYIPLRALAARKDVGRTVIVMGADSIRSEGEVRGSTTSFYNYLYDHYDVLGMTEVDGRLYARSGASQNIRLLVIGDKLPVPRIVQGIQDKLPIIHTYDELWEWAGQVISQYPKPITNIKPAADVSLSTLMDAMGDRLMVVPVTDPVPTPQQKSAVKPVENLVKEEPKQVKRHVNEFQAPYQASSKVGEATAMIPINMAGATYAALNKVISTYGDIDDFVASRLDYTPEELAKYFSPEQVDALALGISSMDEKRGIINADQTGQGKGRFVAAMLRYAKLEGKIPIFATIKPELFTDIFRDINDIGSGHLFKKAFIMNADVDVMVYGTESEVLYSRTSNQDRKEAIERKEIPDDIDIVLTTYSQVARDYEKSPKTHLLEAIAAKNGGNSILLLDESHIAAGESNTGANLGLITEKAGSVMYSSATPLKGVRNFAIYGRVFPSSVDLQSLPDVLAAGGEALQEAISTNMAADGVLIRREHDFSNLTFDTLIPDDDRVEKNRELANELSDILATMMFMSGDVSKLVREKNREFKKEWENMPDSDGQGGRMSANSMSFGSRLFATNRQFLLGLQIEEALKTAIHDLETGKKPVIAVENTGESLLRQLISAKANTADQEDQLVRLKELAGSKPSADEKKQISKLEKEIAEAYESVTFTDVPQFRDYLEIMLEKLGNIKIQGRYGDVRTEQPKSNEYWEMHDSVLEKIRSFPDVPLTGIDLIREGLEEKGYKMAEVSGRTVSLHKQPVKALSPDGGIITTGHEWHVQYHNKPDAVANVAGFQNGKYDAICITRSGSTGISLHATNRFADSDIRQRNFIVLQKAANIAEFLQWLGRVNRKDQVVSPVISTLETALPAELRLTMMHNTKLRKLSANTTSNRNNANIEGDNCDLLNDVGNKVALSWLQENPDIAVWLDITLPDPEKEKGKKENGYMGVENEYINKLMGRLMLLRVDAQEEILGTLMERFKEKVEMLEQQGISPFKVDVFEWGARIKSEENLESGTIRVSDSSFDEAVSVATLNFDVQMNPIKEDMIFEMIKAGDSALNDSILLLDRGVRDRGIDDAMSKLRNELSQGKDHFVRKQLPKLLREDSRTLDELLREPTAVGACNVEAKANYLIRSLPHLRPGALFEVEDPNTGLKMGVITRIKLPEGDLSNDKYLMSHYDLRVVFAGEEKAETMTLSALFNRDVDLSKYGNLITSNNYYSTRFSEIINEAASGMVTKEVTVLRGNLFRACEIASEQSMGKPILYTDSEGNRQRAVLLKHSVTKADLESLPVGMSSQDIVDYVSEFYTKNPSEGYARSVQMEIYSKDIKILSYNDSHFEIIIPGSVSKAGQLIKDGSIFRQDGETERIDSLMLNLTGNRTSMSASLDKEDFPILLERLEANRHVSKFYLPEPDVEILKTLKENFILEQQAKKERHQEQGSENDDGFTLG